MVHFEILNCYGGSCQTFVLWILQEELDARPQDSEVFSTSLLEAEQLNRIRHDLAQVENKLNILSPLNIFLIYKP